MSSVLCYKPLANSSYRPARLAPSITPRRGAQLHHSFGTNGLHGSGFYYGRMRHLSQPEYNSAGATKAKFREHNYGYSVEVSIYSKLYDGRNKTFSLPISNRITATSTRPPA